MHIQQPQSTLELPPEPSFAFSGRFSVLPSPGLIFWRWGGAAPFLCRAPEWSRIGGASSAVPPEDASPSWWRSLSDEDKVLLDKACAECLTGSGAPVELVMRVGQPGKDRGWALVRGDVVVNDKKERELVGYTADISCLLTDRRFFPPAGGASGKSPDPPENPSASAPRPDSGLFPPPAAPFPFRRPLTPDSDTEKGAVGDFGPSDELLAFHRRNIAAVFETGVAVKETASLHTSLRDETIGEYCYSPEFGPDGSVCAVICQMRDFTMPARDEQGKLLNAGSFTALNRLTQLRDISGEESLSAIAEQMALLTESGHGYLFFPEAGREETGDLHCSKSMRDLIGTERPPLKTMPPECRNAAWSDAEESRCPCIVNLKSEDPPFLLFGVLPVRRYIMLPAVENGRVACVAFICNKSTEYGESDLRRLEMFINSVRLALHKNRYMQALEKAKAAAEAANRAKDEFLANVSHELRTPLNGVLAMLQLLQQSALSGEQLEYVRAASLSGQALLRIISDILDFSRMESGKMELRDSVFDLRETLLSAMDPFVSQARSKGLETSVSIDENLPEALVGDDARVRQIVFNLVGNALKFTRQGGIALECSLLPHNVRDSIRVYIAVRDTGIGIPQQAHAAVFDAFTQLDGSSTREYSGTGLGLGIVKHLVRLMGGTLALESEPGEGTTIHCSLPFARTNESPAERRLTGEKRRRLPDAGKARRLDVLVAEDDSVGRFALRKFLLRAGHRAVCVETGRQALEALQLHAFDCLITDIQMPVMDGLETARRIRQGHFAGITLTREVAEAVRLVIDDVDAAPRAEVSPTIPVIALTAHVMNGDREYFLRMGMDMYLAKPVVMEELYALLDRIMAAGSAE